jgi:alpha-amylase
MRLTQIALVGLFIFIASCKSSERAARTSQKQPFVWEAANVYFLLTDRFYDGNSQKTLYLNRTKETGKLRGFEGGNLKGVIQKMKSGYFEELGINAIWMTPLVEQIHDGTDEGTGFTYGFHGYWAKDWTRLDPNFGTEADLAELVKLAHSKGIRIILDGVVNHTGPVTPIDPVWPDSWVRTSPKCLYQTYENTISCTLVENLPDVKTESEANVELPPALIDKWKREGRYESEMASLDKFFQETGYPRAPKYYIIKWLSDYVVKFGIDGYRVDTAKHTEEEVWAALKKVCSAAFEQWKKQNPAEVLDNQPFYMIGEVYNYSIHDARQFKFSDKTVDYFSNGFDNLINFSFKSDANKPYEALFAQYNNYLQSALKGKSVMNYVSSHDDGGPFDKQRKKPFESATKLLLCPGVAQIYYGDETARPLDIPGTQGDATLRSFMNWNDLAQNENTQAIFKHWKKLAQFRKNHPSIGAGTHQQIASKSGYIFKRSYQTGGFIDAVVVGLELPEGKKEIPVSGVFSDGQKLRDAYSGKTTVVKNGQVMLETPYPIVLLEAR